MNKKHYIKALEKVPCNPQIVVNVEDRLAPFSDYEIVGSRWFDEKKDAVVLLVRTAIEDLEG